MPVDPNEVWQLIQRADDLIKYAQNRDPKTAYAQARAVLDEADSKTSDLDASVAQRFRDLIATRRADIDRFDDVP